MSIKIIFVSIANAWEGWLRRPPGPRGTQHTAMPRPLPLSLSPLPERSTFFRHDSEMRHGAEDRRGDGHRIGDAQSCRTGAGPDDWDRRAPPERGPTVSCSSRSHSSAQTRGLAGLTDYTTPCPSRDVVESPSPFPDHFPLLSSLPCPNPDHCCPH